MELERKIITYPGVKPNFYIINTKGNIFNVRTGRMLTSYIDGKGYCRIALQSTKPNKRRIDVGVHRLICWEFNGPYNIETDQVNHIDGCKSNNNPKNLEWCSNSENVKHAIKSGLLKISRKYHFSNENIILACDLILLGLTNIEITSYIYNGLDIYSEEQGNFITTLGCIRAGKSYQDIFNNRKISFNKSDYSHIDIENVRETVKSTRTNVTDYENRAIIEQYRKEGLSEIDILEKMTGYRTSSATIHTKRIYSLIKRVFK